MRKTTSISWLAVKSIFVFDGCYFDIYVFDTCIDTWQLLIEGILASEYEII